jgi:putative FmdB family regulatory protein
MPTYDFRCPSGHEFEQFFRKISDAPYTVRCGVCGADAERRVSGGAGLVFKGSGFYLTDYGRNAHRANGDAGKGEAGKGEAAKGESSKGDSSKGDSAKGDSRPAPAGEAKGGGDSKPAAEAGKPAPAPKGSTGSSE